MTEILRRYISIILIMALVITVIPSALSELSFDEAIIDEEIDESADDDIYGNDEFSDEYPTLQKGDRDGEDSGNIVRLQTRLIELNYLSDEADGVYGQNTVDAVTEFQETNGLTVTGIADGRTQNALYSDSAKEAPIHMDSETVIYRVQEKLILWGFMTGKADGKSGSETRKAISRFNNYLVGYMEIYPTPSPVPTPDPATLTGLGDGLIIEDALLDNSTDEEVTQLTLDYVDGVYEFDVYRETVQMGDSGDEVYRVQRRLCKLKYLYNPDGSFGEATQRSLIYFQKKNGLEQTGIADEATQRVLFSDNVVESEEYINAYKLVVDVSEQKTYIYQWNGTDYSTCLGSTKCSTGMSGKETETPRGTFQAGGPSGTGEWYYFKTYKVYAKWGFFIVGGIMFHSVTYTKEKKLIKGSVSKLGRKASHGCIRLPIDAAKWIYQNCGKGTTVVIQD